MLGTLTEAEPPVCGSRDDRHTGAHAEPPEVGRSRGGTSGVTGRWWPEGVAMITGAGGILGDIDEHDERPAGTQFPLEISATWACNNAAVGLRINTFVAVGSDTAIGEGLRAAAVPLSHDDVGSDRPIGEGLRAAAEPLAADAACSKASLTSLIEKVLRAVAMPLGRWPTGDEEPRITVVVP